MVCTMLSELVKYIFTIVYEDFILLNIYMVDNALFVLQCTHTINKYPFKRNTMLCFETRKAPLNIK